uniref:Uncharacterized protein At1g31720/F27M3_8 n=1 Tax=Arabidopsis thaliana TaxID=3702 RepID=Q8GYH2_ARATH|nr:unknown protein [Arabidopsis thaliana]
MEIQKQDNRDGRPKSFLFFMFIFLFGLAAFFLCLSAEFQKAKVNKFSSDLLLKLCILRSIR